MLTLSFFNNILAPTALSGSFLLVLVFAFCFLGVHVAKYAILGWQQRNQTAKPPPAPPQKEAPTNPPEPVYYIVERKRRREKPKFSEPKEIRFK